MKILLPLLFLSVPVAAQDQVSTGTYSDPTVRLTLNADHTFTINQADPVFTYSHRKYESKGTWQGEGKEIVLNPQFEKRKPTITFTEKYIPEADSVAVKINYLLETYDNEKLISKAPARFELFAVYLNKERNYRNLVREKPGTPQCLFGREIKNPYIADSLPVVRFAGAKAEKIGLKSYGFDNYAVLIPKDPKSNYFEVTVVQPVDNDRAPRNKKVRVTGSEAYYYERNGKYNMLAPLYREKNNP